MSSAQVPLSKDFEEQLFASVIPPDHAYRKINKLIDFVSLVKPLEELYSPLGQHGIFNMLMVINRCHYKNSREQLMFIDGSEVPVCGGRRIFSHKVAKRLAAKSKSTKGWFYGFKLHILCDKEGNLLEVRITDIPKDQ